MQAVGWSMTVFTLLGAVTPGPVNVLAMRHGLAFHARVPVAFVLGSSASYAVVVALMGLGAGQVLGHPMSVQAARWLGTAYLLLLAWRVATSPIAVPWHAQGAGNATQDAWGAFGEGFALQALSLIHI